MILIILLVNLYSGNFFSYFSLSLKCEKLINMRMLRCMSSCVCSSNVNERSYIFFLCLFQAQFSRSSTWETIYEVSAPDATTVTVQNLIPYSNYRLRIIANNIVGPSPPSGPSPDFQTLQAQPAHPPSNMTVRAMSSSLLRVRWIVSLDLLVFHHPVHFLPMKSYVVLSCMQ